MCVRDKVREGREEKRGTEREKVNVSVCVCVCEREREREREKEDCVPKSSLCQ